MKSRAGVAVDSGLNSGPRAQAHLDPDVLRQAMRAPPVAAEKAG